MPIVSSFEPNLSMRTTDRLLISSRCLGFLLVCLGATALSLNAAQTYTWNGGASTAWLTTTNWTPNGIPGADDTAIINSGVPSLPGPSETLPHIQLNGGTLGGQGTVTSTMVWNGGLIRGVVSVATGATLTLTGAGMPHEMTQGGEILNSGVRLRTLHYCPAQLRTCPLACSKSQATIKPMSWEVRLGPLPMRGQCERLQEPEQQELNRLLIITPEQPKCRQAFCR